MRAQPCAHPYDALKSVFLTKEMMFEYSIVRYSIVSLIIKLEKTEFFENHKKLKFFKISIFFGSQRSLFCSFFQLLTVTIKHSIFIGKVSFNSVRDYFCRHFYRKLLLSLFTSFFFIISTEDYFFLWLFLPKIIYLFGSSTEVYFSFWLLLPKITSTKHYFYL